METIKTMYEVTDINSQRKITLGFKCLPIVKARLSQEADEEGLTLSSYVESLINTIPERNNQINNLLRENRNIKNEIGLFAKRIAVYENDYLKKLYDSHKNENVTYINRNGEQVQKLILLMPDVYEVIINSFKYTN